MFPYIKCKDPVVIALITFDMICRVPVNGIYGGRSETKICELSDIVYPFVPINIYGSLKMTCT